MPSTRTLPLVAVWKAQISEIIVDLPEPEEPTRAVTVPGVDSKLMPWRTGLSGS